MLLGVERRRKDAGAGDDDGGGEQEEEYGAVPMASVRSDSGARRGDTISEEYKDVDMVSIMSGSSSSLDTGSGHRSRDAYSMGSRFSVPEEDLCDSESVASNFEFHKERGASARSAPAAAVLPFSKHPPSKWDDAQKWIASPTTNRPSRASNGAFPRKMEKSGFGGGRLPATKVVLEAVEEIDTKRIDPSQEKREIGWQKAVNWATPDPYPEVEPCANSTLAAESMIVDSPDSAGVGVLVLGLAVRYPPRLELLHPSTIFTSQADNSRWLRWCASAGDAVQVILLWSPTLGRSGDICNVCIVAESSFAWR